MPNVDLVCLAGWLCLLEIPPKYQGRVMNIHPALLPSFGGKGMFGARVHQAVLDHGCKMSGCTVHFVDAGYDTGPIIIQRTCPVLDDDTAETLAHRVFEEEKIAYPQAIRLFQAGRLKVQASAFECYRSEDAARIPTTRPTGYRAVSGRCRVSFVYSSWRGSSPKDDRHEIGVTAESERTIASRREIAASLARRGSRSLPF